MTKLFLHLSTNMNSICSYCNINYYHLSHLLVSQWQCLKGLEMYDDHIFYLEAKLTYVLVLKQQILSTYWMYTYPFTWLKMKAWEGLEAKLKKDKIRSLNPLKCDNTSIKKVQTCRSIASIALHSLRINNICQTQIKSLSKKSHT